MNNFSKLIPVLISICALTACAQSGSNYTSPQGYDLNHPQRHMLPATLKEISGICFRPGDQAQVYAIQDEDGVVYSWPAVSKRLRFAGHGDFEDISISKDRAVVLRSDGKLYTFPAAALGQTNPPQVQEWKGLLPEGEYEAMAFDTRDNLYILCKNCPADKNRARASGYELRIDNTGKPVVTEEFRINDLERLVPGNKGNLKASAMAYNTQTREWYILSSVHKLLLVTDQQWHPRAAYHLDPKLFPQPEGICFDSGHNLYISNEIADGATATLLMFPYRTKP